MSRPWMTWWKTSLLWPIIWNSLPRIGRPCSAWSTAGSHATTGPWINPFHCSRRRLAMPDYIADDYAFINQRMRELSLDTPPAKTRWGVWWTTENIWLNLDSADTIRRTGG